MTRKAGMEGESSRGGHIAHGALRGVIAAQAMTGLRAFTISAGLVDEPPPRAVLRQKSVGLFAVLPKRHRRAAQELAHWVYGAAGGAGFAALPEGVRKRPWFGPIYGVLLWFGFEVVQAPLMGLKQAQEFRPIERAALAIDHLLFGLVLSETRRQPRT